MSKKTHSITLVFIGLLFSAAAAEVSADASAGLAQEKANIISLIKDGNYAQAQEQTQKLLADFSKNQATPEALYDIAENFRWYGTSDRDKDKYARAGEVYRLIIENYPGNPFADKAALGIAKTKVLYLIVAQDFNAAGLALNEMAATFPNHPNLGDELYWIGRAYGYWERHEEEKDAYQQIIQNHPDNQYADRARLGFAKANVQSLIMSKDYDGAKKALDKMVADFSKHPDLPEALYWIAERYNWADKYEEAKSIHQKIIKEFPDSSFVTGARLGFSKSEVMSLMTSKEYEKGEKAFDKLFTAFKGHPDLPRAVLAIGEQCSQQGLSKGNEDLAQAEAFFDMSDKAIGRLIADFPKYPDLAEAVQYIGHLYYTKARLMSNEGDIEGGKVFYRKAIEVWERLIHEFPNSKIIPNAYYSSAVCYAQELEEYQKGIDYFQKVAENYPDYEYAQRAKQLIAEYYNKMENSKNEK